MQTVGIQTVLQMSHAAERVQAVEQLHSPLAAEQAKEAIEKHKIEMMDTINQTEQTENAKIRDEDRRRKQEERRGKEKKGAQPLASAAEEKKPRPAPSADDTVGKLLNITA